MSQLISAEWSKARLFSSFFKGLTDHYIEMYVDPDHPFYVKDEQRTLSKAIELMKEHLSLQPPSFNAPVVTLGDHDTELKDVQKYTHSKIITEALLSFKKLTSMQEKFVDILRYILVGWAITCILENRGTIDAIKADLAHLKANFIDVEVASSSDETPAIPPPASSSTGDRAPTRAMGPVLLFWDACSRDHTFTMMKEFVSKYSVGFRMFSHVGPQRMCDVGVETVLTIALERVRKTQREASGPFWSAVCNIIDERCQNSRSGKRKMSIRELRDGEDEGEGEGEGDLEESANTEEETSKRRSKRPRRLLPSSREADAPAFHRPRQESGVRLPPNTRATASRLKQLDAAIHALSSISWKSSHYAPKPSAIDVSSNISFKCRPDEDGFDNHDYHCHHFIDCRERVIDALESLTTAELNQLVKDEFESQFDLLTGGSFASVIFRLIQKFPESLRVGAAIEATSMDEMNRIVAHHAREVHNLLDTSRLGAIVYSPSFITNYSNQLSHLPPIPVGALQSTQESKSSFEEWCRSQLVKHNGVLPLGDRWYIFFLPGGHDITDKHYAREAEYLNRVCEKLQQVMKNYGDSHLNWKSTKKNMCLPPLSLLLKLGFSLFVVQVKQQQALVVPSSLSIPREPGSQLSALPYAVFTDKNYGVRPVVSFSNSYAYESALINHVKNPKHQADIANHGPTL